MVLRPTRRSVLTLISAISVLACTPVQKKKPRKKNLSGDNSEPGKLFAHGVASGDPNSESIVLWTRITLNTPRSDQTYILFWEISQDEGFSNPVSAGTVKTDADRDYTVKVLVRGLESGKTYYYRFRLGEVFSPTGRTKTLPTGPVSRFGIALASCSNYPFGYFNAYDAIAKDPHIDCVLHTGDYLYEYGAKGWGGETGQCIGRQHDPKHEILSLSDYRLRHAQYKSDKGSRAMHAAHPLICCWDDHESANNPWIGGAQNHQPEKEGNWEERRAASIQAYYEWMPIREPDGNHTRIEFWRSYVIGDLASLVTLETRHTARARQIDYLDYLTKIKTHQDAENFKKHVLGKTGRLLISQQMQDELVKIFKHSKENHQPWRLIGNAIPMAKMTVPDIEALGVLSEADSRQKQSDHAKLLCWKGQYNLPFYTDSWDGYPWAREQLYQALRSENIEDVLVLTGDSHSFWMNRLCDDQNHAIGVEIGTAGITSPGDFLESGWDDKTAHRLDRVFEQKVKEVVWTDNFHQGYVRIELFPEYTKADFIAVNTVLIPKYSVKTIKQAEIVHTENTLDYQPAAPSRL